VTAQGEERDVGKKEETGCAAIVEKQRGAKENHKSVATRTERAAVVEKKMVRWGDVKKKSREGKTAQNPVKRTPGMGRKSTHKKEIGEQ